MTDLEREANLGAFSLLAEGCILSRPAPIVLQRDINRWERPIGALLLTMAIFGEVSK
jgi:hypothetical protein